MLPAVIRWLGLARDVEKERKQEMEAELAARREALRTRDLLAAARYTP